MGKRKSSEEEAEKIKKKLKKWEKRLKRAENRSTTEVTSETPTASITAEINSPTSPKDDSTLISDDDTPEELLEALGPEGADSNEVGEPLHEQLTLRWSNIIRDGLKKETRDSIVKKYPSPENFNIAAPILNPEIKAIMSDNSIKRDNRIVQKQNLTGKLLLAIGKTITNVIKGNINSKDIVENLSNAAKMGADLFHQESMSRRYFAIAGTTPEVKEAIKNEKPDEFLFGKTCSEKIKSAQVIQKTSTQIKQKNFKGPLPQPKPRNGQFRSQPAQQYRSRATRPQQKPYKKSQPKKRSPPSSYQHRRSHQN